MINFNDGFGGGSEIVNNLVLNSCRESSGAPIGLPVPVLGYIVTTPTGRIRRSVRA
jgi:hypothetical protein